MTAQQHIHPSQKSTSVRVQPDLNSRKGVFIAIDFPHEGPVLPDPFVPDVGFTLTSDEARALAEELFQVADQADLDAEPPRLVAGELYRVVPAGMCTEGSRLRATGEIRVGARTVFHEMVGYGGRLIWVPDSEVTMLWSVYAGED